MCRIIFLHIRFFFIYPPSVVSESVSQYFFDYTLPIFHGDFVFLQPIV